MKDQYLLLPLPVNTYWFKDLVEMEKRYCTYTGMQYMLHAVFERQLNPNDNSDVTDEVFEDMYTRYEEIHSSEFSEDVVNQRQVEFGEKIVDMFIQLDYFYQPFYSLIELIDGENPNLVPSIGSIFHNSFILFVEGGRLCKPPL